MDVIVIVYPYPYFTNSLALMLLNLMHGLEITLYPWPDIRNNTVSKISL